MKQCRITYIDATNGKIDPVTFGFIKDCHIIEVDFNNLFAMSDNTELRNHIEEIRLDCCKAFDTRIEKLTIYPRVYLGFAEQAHALYFKLNFRM